MTDAAFAYLLLDPREIAAEAPYTYFLPQAAELAAVGVGDLVKLVIEHTAPAKDYQVERMWVAVRLADGNSLEGSLENKPFEPTATLAAGQSIHFQRHHIISINWADPACAPTVTEPRQYWARCLVDRCVLDDGVPVEYLYRDEPDMAEASDTHPDSGWRIRGRMGSDTDEQIEAREIAYVALGAVLNHDDTWLHLINAPVGAAFMRHFKTGEYVEDGQEP